MADKPKEYPYLIKDEEGAVRYGSNPRKKAAEMITMKAQKSGTLPTNILYSPNPIANQIGMAHFVDEEDVINYLPYERKQEVVEENPQFLSREDWLESQKPPLKKTDIIKGWGLDIDEVEEAIEAQRFLLPEGKGGWDPERISDINPMGAYGDRDWWIKHGDPEGTDGLGDGSWKTGPSEADAWAHKPIMGSTILDPMQGDISILKEAIKLSKEKK